MAEYTPPSTVNPIFNPQIFNLRDKVGTTITAGDIADIDTAIADFETELTPYNFVGTAPQTQISYTAASGGVLIATLSGIGSGSFIITLNGQAQFPTTSYNWIQTMITTTALGGSSVQQANIQTPPNVPRPTIANVNNIFFVRSSPAGSNIGVNVYFSSDVNCIIAADSFLFTIVKTIGSVA